MNYQIKKITDHLINKTLNQSAIKKIKSKLEV
jgi:hypothetical protein